MWGLKYLPISAFFSMFLRWVFWMKLPTWSLVVSSTCLATSSFWASISFCCTPAKWQLFPSSPRGYSPTTPFSPSTVASSCAYTLTCTLSGWGMGTSPCSFTPLPAFGLVITAQHFSLLHDVCACAVLWLYACSGLTCVHFPVHLGAFAQWLKFVGMRSTGFHRPLAP